MKTLINLGKNVNVGEAVIVGLGCEMADAENIREINRSTAKVVNLMGLHELGSMFETIASIKGQKHDATFRKTCFVVHNTFEKIRR